MRRQRSTPHRSIPQLQQSNNISLAVHPAPTCRVLQHAVQHATCVTANFSLTPLTRLLVDLPLIVGSTAVWYLLCILPLPAEFCSTQYNTPLSLPFSLVYLWTYHLKLVAEPCGIFGASTKQYDSWCASCPYLPSPAIRSITRHFR